MSIEILSQDEIDDLIDSINNDIEPVIMPDLSGMVTPQMVYTVRAMFKRYYFALTHCSFEEQRIAKDNLRQAAFKVWLSRYGFNSKSDYAKFINTEAEKRGLGWKLRVL